MTDDPDAQDAINLLVSKGWDRNYLLKGAPGHSQLATALVLPHVQGLRAYTDAVRANAHPFMFPDVKEEALRLLDKNGMTSRNSPDWKQENLIEALYDYMSRHPKLKRMTERNRSNDGRALRPIYEIWMNKH